MPIEARAVALFAEQESIPETERRPIVDTVRPAGATVRMMKTNRLVYSSLAA